MSLYAELLAANSPPQEEAAKVKMSKEDRRKALQQATAKAKTDAGIARYRNVMEGNGWMTQTHIECALGYSPAVSSGFLKRLINDLHLVERRNRGGTLHFDPCQGYEYRWLDECPAEKKS